MNWRGDVRVPSHALDLDGGAIVVGGKSNALMFGAANARREQGDDGSQQLRRSRHRSMSHHILHAANLPDDD